VPREGDAFVEFHADTSEVAPEAERGIKVAAERVERDLDKTGKDFGDTLAKSMGKEFEREGARELATGIEKGLARQKIKTRVKVEFDKDNNVIKRTVESTFQDIEDAFDKAGQPGGPVDKFGRGIRDAVGSAFNVSGQSPLIAFLIPAFGALGALIIAAFQAANALVAVIGTVPAALAGIGVQVGVLLLAFRGLGGAITAAFAAKNAKELNQAIKDLTPSAQKFVRELLPLRDLFNFLAKATQESFFKSLGSVLPQLQRTLGPAFFQGFTSLATSLGTLFRNLALFFSSAEFVSFLNALFPATIQFLRSFGPDFIEFLKGVTVFSRAILPFLTFLGTKLSDALFELGAFLLRTSKDPSFKKWLSDMADTLLNVGKLIGSVIDFVAVLLAQLNTAGGAELINQLADAIATLTSFLATPAGEKGLEGLIDATLFLTKAFLGLIGIIVGLLAVLELVGEWVNNTGGPAVLNFLQFLGGAIVTVATALGVAIQWFVTTVGEGLSHAWASTIDFFKRLWQGVTGFVDNLLATARSLPDRIIAALASLGRLMFDAGRNVINSLIDGIKSKFGVLASIISSAAQVVRDHWPFSPAKTGPLSGAGDPMLAGQNTMARYAEGLRMEIPAIKAASSEAISNIVFGRDAIRVSFEGALPTQQQAQQTGAAVGAGINGQLAARNTRLAVRTL
jgi:phage-related protein